MKNKFFNKSSQKGFTLLEMIVSLGIFTVVAVIAVGALIKVMDANKKSINLKNTINNLNFTLESMSREMRVGSGYFCEEVSGNNNGNIVPSYNPSGQDCNSVVAGDNWIIAFRSSNRSSDNTCNLIYAYKFNGSAIQKAQQNNSCNEPINRTDSFTDLTSSNIKFSNAIVTVNGPYATFFFSGTSGLKAKDKVDFAIQTSVSQRIK